MLSIKRSLGFELELACDVYVVVVVALPLVVTSTHGLEGGHNVPNLRLNQNPRATRLVAKS